MKKAKRTMYAWEVLKARYLFHTPRGLGAPSDRRGDWMRNEEFYALGLTIMHLLSEAGIVEWRDKADLPPNVYAKSYRYFYHGRSGTWFWTQAAPERFAALLAEAEARARQHVEDMIRDGIMYPPQKKEE